ncbi:MAG: hypothetical protein OXD42_12100 [Rhodospirillaceae bacterium]|nr:hypothetical protein [Rhodospirillaceae bacterium]
MRMSTERPARTSCQAMIVITLGAFTPTPTFSHVVACAQAHPVGSIRDKHDHGCGRRVRSHHYHDDIHAVTCEIDTSYVGGEAADA